MSAMAAHMPFGVNAVQALGVLSPAEAGAYLQRRRFSHGAA